MVQGVTGDRPREASSTGSRLLPAVVASSNDVPGCAYKPTAAAAFSVNKLASRM